MPDSFFVTKSRKRKRTDSSGPKKPAFKSKNKAVQQTQSKRKPRRDEELDSDETQEDGIDAIDDLDLRHGVDEPMRSDDEDTSETPAQKRLRLAKVYLDSLKEGLGK